MVRPQIGKYSISRRDLLYAFYGLASFTTLVSCGINNGSTNNSNANNSSVSLGNNATTTSNTKEKSPTKLVRLGYQVSGDLTHEKGVIEKRLAPQGIGVTWSQFVSGPPLLEALNVGSIDLGPTGETPPIFAQAAGTDLIYVVNIPPGTGEGSAIIVLKDSPIQTLAGVKGKKVAYSRGTAQTFFVVKALEEAGLKISDIESVNLTVADGRAAFLNKTVDAFVEGDPYLIKLQKEGSIRVLRNAQGIKTPGSYYLASRDFVTNNAELLKAILSEYYQVGQWANKNRRAAAEILAPKVKTDVDTMELTLARRKYDMKPITEEVISAQQKVADLLYELKVVPKQVDVKGATLTTQQYAAITPDAVRNKA
ncbi:MULTISPECIES: aliphatic sulfonate ABC transporter substrate-binding protein [unclassified Nostoc]|uniref:aliphatic sulfonate ABC transporter substrate-binding protein n=1 Tax=unclassified Nostoc TaxID=2593658 RepID=UPI002622FCA9|nr:aliphatic sulfonate ABC transporter substrate-binding protein [Nostoc sp. S13]MDF5738562.1 aliphatic sulfonate ABC transporter substrate-binding protein [Nostoc sp. S13]